MTASPGRLEFAARYTHTYRDGRRIEVTSVNHENPADRVWAEERVAEMVRAQMGLAKPVDAHLVTRSAATEWAPERTVCAHCGTSFGPVAGVVPAVPLWRCSPGCPIPAEGCSTPERFSEEQCCGGGPRDNCPCMHPELDAITPETAAHVLFHLGRGGWPASQFIQHLLRSFETADIVNRARLGVGFPEYLAAFELYRSSDSGVAKLQAIVDKDDVL